MKKLLLLLLLLLPLHASYSQKLNSTNTVIVSATDPTGNACSSTSPSLSYGTGNTRNIYTCQSGVYAVGTGSGAVADATITSDGKQRLGEVTYVASSGAKPTCNASSVNTIITKGYGNRSNETCKMMPDGTYAWVDASRYVNVASYGIISDGSTDQTSALTTLFAGDLSGYAGIIYIPHNTKFNISTVYAAIPATARVEDESEINWGQPPTYVNRFKVFGSNGATANDTQVMIADTHHPAMTLNNLRTSGSGSAALARASILFAGGIRANKDPLYTGYWQLAKQQSSNTWAWSWIRYSEWNAVGATNWTTATAYSAGVYVRNGDYYYSTVAGGTSGATPPTHTSGSVSDGGVTWVYVGPIVSEQLLMQIDEGGNLGIGTQADSTSNLTVTEPGASTNTVITFANVSSSSQIIENRTAENSGGTPTTIQQITDGNGLTLIKNATTNTPIAEHSTTQFYTYVPFVSGANLTSGLAANGGSNRFTLRGYSPNGTNGSYGRMYFSANSNLTADARQWLVTNATNKFRIIRSVDAATEPTLDSTGAVTSGLENLSLDKDGHMALTGNLAVSGTFTLSGTPQTLTGAGAVNVITDTTLIVTTGANALTLADGTAGQVKTIVMKTDGGDGTLTPTNLAGATTITFNDVGDTVTLKFIDGKWYIVGQFGVAIA